MFLNVFIGSQSFYNVFIGSQTFYDAQMSFSVSCDN